MKNLYLGMDSAYEVKLKEKGDLKMWNNLCFNFWKLSTPHNKNIKFSLRIENNLMYLFCQLALLSHIHPELLFQ